IGPERGRRAAASVAGFTTVRDRDPLGLEEEHVAGRDQRRETPELIFGPIRLDRRLEYPAVDAGPLAGRRIVERGVAAEPREHESGNIGAVWVALAELER